MPNIPAGKIRPKPRSLSKEVRGQDDSEGVRIRTSMRRWQAMDGPARLLGRGLGMKELVDRVALEVGASPRQVHCAIKPDSHDQ